MLGKKISAIYSFPKNIITKLFGHLDINIRQKWNILFPILKQNIGNKQLSLLDAGTGEGEWMFELSLRYPNLTCTGVDFSEKAINTAKKNASKLGLNSTEIYCNDFLKYTPNKEFDIILSVASYHYLMEINKGDELFSRTLDWLKPEGKLICFIPRTASEVTISGKYKPLPKHSVASYKDIEGVCNKAGFVIEKLTPCINSKAILAKQMYASLGGIKKLIAYPKMLQLSNKANLLFNDINTTSYAWVLIASKPK